MEDLDVVDAQTLADGRVLGEVDLQPAEAHHRGIDGGAVDDPLVGDPHVVQHRTEGEAELHLEHPADAVRVAHDLDLTAVADVVEDQVARRRALQAQIEALQLELPGLEVREQKCERNGQVAPGDLGAVGEFEAYETVVVRGHVLEFQRRRRGDRAADDRGQPAVVDLHRLADQRATGADRLTEGLVVEARVQVLRRAAGCPAHRDVVETEVAGGVAVVLMAHHERAHRVAQPPVRFVLDHDESVEHQVPGPVVEIDLDLHEVLLSGGVGEELRDRGRVPVAPVEQTGAVEGQIRDDAHQRIVHHADGVDIDLLGDDHALQVELAVTRLEHVREAEVQHVAVGAAGRGVGQADAAVADRVEPGLFVVGVLRTGDGLAELRSAPVHALQQRPLVEVGVEEEDPRVRGVGQRAADQGQDGERERGQGSERSGGDDRGEATRVHGPPRTKKGFGASDPSNEVFPPTAHGVPPWNSAPDLRHFRCGTPPFLHPPRPAPRTLRLDALTPPPERRARPGPRTRARRGEETHDRQRVAPRRCRERAIAGSRFLPLPMNSFAIEIALQTPCPKATRSRQCPPYGNPYANPSALPPWYTTQLANHASTVMYAKRNTGQRRPPVSR